MPSHPNILTRDINLGPLVDLCLILLIVTMVVIPMLRHERAPVPARLAASQQADHLAVAMAADGAVFIEQRQVAQEELPELLVALHVAGPDRPVLVQGDRRLRYSQVRELMGEIYRAGFQRVALTMAARPAA